MTSEAFRAIPSVETVLSDDRIGTLTGEFSRSVVTELVRAELDSARKSVRAGNAAPSIETVVDGVIANARSTWVSWPERVINATGVVLHTNLGRAPLSKEAIDAAGLAARGYSDLEFDLDSGKRGSRNSHISKMIAQVTGSEAGMAVNNNASAVLLALSALAEGKEVIVSRGEAVEIGGGFRVPDVMAQSGARLVEVGTTNRTYARDYEKAITENTAVILKVHPSNFLVTGFTHTPELSELVEVGRKHDVPVLNDLGSGSLLDTRKYGMEHEPMAQESISEGAGLTMFSGDKLLGGPQAGIFAGDLALVDKVSKHPLARAVRIDKMTLAALSGTLLSYLTGTAESEIPIWRMISANEKEITSRAIAWQAAVGTGEVRAARSAIGGGSLPGQTIGTSVLSISTPGKPDDFAAMLRKGSPPVIARIQENEILLDPRTVLPEEDEAVIATVKSALGAQ